MKYFNVSMYVTLALTATYAYTQKTTLEHLKEITTDIGKAHAEYERAHTNYNRELNKLRLITLNILAEYCYVLPENLIENAVKTIAKDVGNTTTYQESQEHFSNALRIIQENSNKECKPCQFLMKFINEQQAILQEQERKKHKEIEELCK